MPNNGPLLFIVLEAIDLIHFQFLTMRINTIVMQL